MGLKLIKKKQCGFTLIELMIVIGVIGILATLALSAYQEYQIRSQVSESLGLMAGLKNNIAEYHTEKGSFPPDNSLAGASKSGSIIGKYVSDVTIIDGVIKATLGYEINETVRGEIVEMSPTFAGGSFIWKCDTPGTTVPAKYLPSVCR